MTNVFIYLFIFYLDLFTLCSILGHGLIMFLCKHCILNGFNCLAGELVKITANVITKWQKLLKDYLSTIDEEVRMLISLMTC